MLLNVYIHFLVLSSYQIIFMYVMDYLISFYLNFNNIQCSVCKIYVLIVFTSNCVKFAPCRTIKYRIYYQNDYYSKNSTNHNLHSIPLKVFIWGGGGRKKIVFLRRLVHKWKAELEKCEKYQILYSRIGI
jgi:hypothetical protein